MEYRPHSMSSRPKCKPTLSSTPQEQGMQPSPWWKKNGPGVLLSGLGPTIIGFGIEGGIKFGVYESLKPFFMMLLHTDSKTIPYLAASVGAGMVAAAMLCPMERTRIKMVTSEEKTGPVSTQYIRSCLLPSKQNKTPQSHLKSSWLHSSVASAT